MKSFVFLLAVLIQTQDIYFVSGCTETVKDLPDVNRRSPSYRISSGEQYVKDSTLRSGWYIAHNNDFYYDMIYTTPSLGDCGTYNPVYIVGSKPSLVNGEEKDLEACLVDFENDCRKRYNIKIRKCNNEIQYFLKPTDGPSAYCFEQTTAAIAPAPDYKISGSIRVGPALMYVYNETRNADFPYLDFKCHYSGSYNYLYEISWFVNGHFEYSSQRLNMSDIDQANINETTLLDAGYGLGITLQCGVRISSHIRGNQTHTQTSDSFFAGIKVLNRMVTMTKGDSVTIRLQPTVPLGCLNVPNTENNACGIDITMFDPNTTYSCSEPRIANVKLNDDHKTCGQTITGWPLKEARRCLNNHHPSCAYIVFPVTNFEVTTVNDKEKYAGGNTFSIHLKTNDLTFHKFWNASFIDIIQVHVHENESWFSKICSETGDPRMINFFGSDWTLNIYNEIFLLYGQPSLGLEVQIQTFDCLAIEDGPCVCAVAIRAGGDVFIIDVCPENVEKIIHFTYCRSNVLRVRNITEINYDIYFPTGTRVNVIISSWNKTFLNIQIHPTPYDNTHRPDGLCGNLNEDQDNDDQFSRRWIVEERNSLIRNVGVEFPTNWNYTRQVCLCPSVVGTNVNATVICVTEAYQACKEKINIEGELKKCHIRKKRSFERQIQNNIRRLKRREAELQTRSQLQRITRQSGIMDQEAYESAYLSCVHYFEKKTAYSMRNRLPDMLVNRTLRACALDAMADPLDNVWKQTHFQGWTNMVGSEIKKNVTFQRVSEKVVSEFKNVTCPGDCSMHGECINGTCRCFDDYVGSTCLIQLSAPLTIYDIEGGGFCDLALGDDCHECLQIHTELILPNFTCRIEVYEMKRGQQFAKNKIINIFGEYDSIYSGFCCPNVMDSNRKRREVTDSADQIFATRYDIAISNNGIHFSGSLPVIVFDSTCQEYASQEDEEAIIILKENTCFINGKCYTYGQKQINSDCEVCYPSENTFEWTHACSVPPLDDENNTGNTDDNSSAKVTIVVIIGPIIGVLAILTGSFLVYKRKCTKRCNVETSENMPNVGEAEYTNTNQVFFSETSFASKALPPFGHEYMNQYPEPTTFFDQTNRYMYLRFTGENEPEYANTADKPDSLEVTTSYENQPLPAIGHE